MSQAYFLNTQSIKSLYDFEDKFVEFRLKITCLGSCKRTLMNLSVTAVMNLSYGRL